MERAASLRKLISDRRCWMVRISCYTLRIEELLTIRDVTLGGLEREWEVSPIIYDASSKYAASHVKYFVFSVAAPPFDVPMNGPVALLVRL